MCAVFTRGSVRWRRQGSSILYTQKTFGTGLNSDAYRKNFDDIFKKEEVVTQVETKELKPKKKRKAKKKK